MLAVAVVFAINAYATDYILDLTGKKGNLYWDQTQDLWSGGTEGSAWYPYPEPDADDSLPNLTVKINEKINIYCYGKTSDQSFPMSYNGIVFNTGNYHLFAKNTMPVEIGAGGLVSGGTFGEMSGPFTLLASQVWKQRSVANNIKSSIHASFSAGPDVTWRSLP